MISVGGPKEKKHTYIISFEVAFVLSDGPLTVSANADIGPKGDEEQAQGDA